MSSKSEDKPQSNSLFVSEEGEPLSFYLRPGPIKQQLLPLIKAGGGLMCNFQKTGTILLKDPEERASIPKSTTHWYVSTRYIQDCIEKNEKLNIEEYRLIPESPNSAKPKSNGKVGSPALSAVRSAYTTEEDNAILSYVSKHENEIGGNRLWQEMAKLQVTSHSWQSMKYRYRVQLVHKLSACKQTDTEEENKTTDTDQTEADNKSTSPQNIPDEPEDPENISAEMDLTQISSDSQEEQADVEPAKCHNSDSMETSKSEIDETPEQQQPGSSATEKDAPTETTAKPVLNDKSSPKSINRPVTRRQLELENIPYVKKLRSGTSPGSLVIVPQHLHRSKPVSSTKRIQTEAQSPPKKVRRKTESNVAEQIQEERESGSSEMTQIDEGNSLAAQPKPTEKKTEKRKLGILEMATKEFEDDSESDSDLQCETPGPSTCIEAVKGSSNSVHPSALNSENQEKDPATTQAEQNPQPTTTDTATAPTTSNNASTSDPAISEVTIRGNPPSEQALSKAHLFIFESDSQELEEDSEVTTRGNPPTEQASSKAHLFIFESESQEPEEVSQSLVGSTSCAPIQTHETKNSPSLTQEQLEEDVQLLRDFMKHTNQSLINVTKALLQASGDLFLAYEILQNPSSFSGPIWTRTDDQRLCSTDQEVRQDLLTKYGEEAMAKRLQFLEIEG